MTEQKATPSKDGQAGVEVTPEMVEAGRAVMREFYDDEVLQAPDQLLLQIYVAMTEVSGPKTSQV